MRYFEDFTVGETARFGSYQVDRDEVLDFARRYDPQPFHLSEEAAAQTHFGRLAASGWHSCAMMMAMLAARMEADEVASLGAAGIDELRWRTPVYPGDTLTCETEIVETRASRSRPEMGTARSRMTVRNQDGVAVLTFVAILLIATRPRAATTPSTGTDAG
ncbi:MaoC family dehydratase [Sphingomonas sp. CFBP 13720]|uniref:MaoC family dehydratase n=1 Tax=Sphingomonas sp. CFBP 13720 TaxID=2775302 RepID=UPI00177B03C9|nr:MaoC family dehydratase [Sphingomonas sp. CFBP 13720]MBD8678085.1 MaoC family dehydratase [Sphingomonas sp. CFBP 13720]